MNVGDVFRLNPVLPLDLGTVQGRPHDLKGGLGALPRGKKYGCSLQKISTIREIILILPWFYILTTVTNTNAWLSVRYYASNCTKNK